MVETQTSFERTQHSSEMNILQGKNIRQRHGFLTNFYLAPPWITPRKVHSSLFWSIAVYF